MYQKLANIARTLVIIDVNGVTGKCLLSDDDHSSFNFLCLPYSVDKLVIFTNISITKKR